MLIPIAYITSGGPRISPRWGRQPFGGAPTYNFAKFSEKKLHEIERIWTGGHPKFYHVDPPQDYIAHSDRESQVSIKYTLFSRCLWILSIQPCQLG